jgi:HipA-like C-terminal domain
MHEAQIRQLLRSGACRPTVLIGTLGISQPTLSRALAKMRGEVLQIGRGRATAYALRREVRGLDRFPVYRIDEKGNVEKFGLLRPLIAGQFWWQPDQGASTLHHGLPWFIESMRPAGFLGRALAHRLGEQLDLPERLADWGADDVLPALDQIEDGPGNLIVGDRALNSHRRLTEVGLRREDRTTAYPQRAQAALRGEIPGSSAGGEQPKFTALVENRQVLVKFSPSVKTSEGRRWADLLHCEHLALTILREAGIAAAECDILEAGGHVFLESNRFDRSGTHGRRPLVSLEVVGSEFLGNIPTWLNASYRLEEAHLLSREDAETIRLLDLFGNLIGNTDRHAGNLSFFPSSLDARPHFKLAPAYDMLPMCHRPMIAGIPTEPWDPPLSPGASLSVQKTAMKMAEEFWSRAVAEPSISGEFRSVSAANLAKLHGCGR